MRPSNLQLQPFEEPTPFFPALSNQQPSLLRVGTGFHNDGNTCYLSAALVILLSRSSFVNQLVSAYRPVFEQNQSVFGSEFPCLMELTSLATWKCFDPEQHLKSGRMASILRAAAPGGFKRGLQHDCHEALTYILSLAHEEEMKLLKRRQHGSKSDADDKTMERHGVVARNFGIEEHVALTVRIHHHLFCESMVYCICLSNIFGSAAIALTCARSSTSGSSSLFP